jgi:hypothetical protein
MPSNRISRDANLLNSGGYVISAVFTCAEYQRLGKVHRRFKILRVSFWIKLFFIIVEVILAIGEDAYRNYH